MPPVSSASIFFSRETPAGLRVPVELRLAAGHVGDGFEPETPGIGHAPFDRQRDYVWVEIAERIGI